MPSGRNGSAGDTCMPRIAPHAGFAISVVDEKEALETLKYLAAMDAVPENP